MRLLRVLLALLASLTAGCWYSRSDMPGPTVWAAGDMLQLTDRSTPSADGVWRPESSTVELFSAINETVSFQLVIDAPPQGAAGVKVTAGPLSAEGGATLPRESVRLFSMQGIAVARFPAWYLRLTDGPIQPASFYDILTPLPEAPGADLPARQRLAVWADLYVPRHAQPGAYAGPLTVTSSAGTVRLKLALKVYDFVLPDIRPVACLGGFSHEAIFRHFFRRPPGATASVAPGAGASPARPRPADEPVAPARMDVTNKDVAGALVIIRQLMRLAHEHRLDLFDRDLTPMLKRDDSGQVVLGWEDYDAIVKPYLDGTAFDDRLGVPAWPAPVHAGWPDSRIYGGPDNPMYRQTLAAAFFQSARHFEALGFADRLFGWCRTDPTGAEAYRCYAALARQLRSGDAGVPLLAELPPSPPAQTGWTAPEDFARLADLYAPSAELLDADDAPRLARNDSKLAGLWLRPHRPPCLGGLSVLAPPADIRALPWLSLRYGCAGIFLPETLGWPDEPTDWLTDSHSRLFYPRPDGQGVLASVRLKRLRRGLQDVCYLWLLRQRQQPVAAEAMLRALARYAGVQAAGDHHLDTRLDGWARDSRAWLLARQVLAEQVYAAVHPEAVAGRNVQAEKLAQGRLNELACQVRLERLRGRIDPDGGLFRLTLWAELFNESPAPADAQLQVLALPKDFKSLDGGLRQIHLVGQQRLAVDFAARGPEMPTTPEGKLAVPMALTVGAAQRKEFTAWAALATPAEVARGPSIDGDLGDWPIRAGNSCGRFVLLGRRNALGEGLARRQTLVFLLRDQANLYLAFRCEQPKDEPLVAGASNVVAYEQLLATGEDLVEVVLDPGRSAKGVEDLYHLVVKANGVVVAQRGIPSSPPLGKCRPWAAAIRSAVGRTDKAWTVELAIPLEDLGSAAGQAFWGANFARFCRADNEASSWAGSPRTFYDPGGLGTICLDQRIAGGK